MEEELAPTGIVEGFWHGCGILETLISGGTTEENLRYHHFGGQELSSSASMGRVYGTLSPAHLDRAISLLKKSYDVLRAYHAEHKDSTSKLYGSNQKERIERLEKQNLSRHYDVI